MKGIFRRWIAVLQESGDKDERMPDDSQEKWFDRGIWYSAEEETKRPIFSGKGRSETKEIKEIKETKEVFGLYGEAGTEPRLGGKAVESESLGEEKMQEPAYLTFEPMEEREIFRFWDREVSEKEREGISPSIFNTKREEKDLFQGESISKKMFQDAEKEPEKESSIVEKESYIGTQEMLLSRICGLLAKEKEMTSGGSPQISLQVGQVGNERDLDSMVQALTKRLREERQSNRKKIGGV